MLDIKRIRRDPQKTETILKTRVKDDIEFSKIIEIDKKVRELQTEAEELKAKHNAISKEIGLKKQKKEDTTSLFTGLDELKQAIHQLDMTIAKLEKEREKMLAYLPNIPMVGVPLSLDERDNLMVKKYKEKKDFTFPFKSHLELNEKMHLFDFKRGAKVAGSGFLFYTGRGARLEWALLNYMLNIHIKNGFKFILPPLLAKEEIMYGSAHLPKFEDQIFKITDEDYDLYFIPTSEVVLNGLHFDEILEEEELPLRYVTYTPCFRREAGAAGKAERGLIRTHQFNKVELFCICRPEDSENIFNEMLNSAEEVLKGLDLHYRNMLLCSGETSFASAKTIDIEVFLPSQDRYYEVSSVSNCTDFQARRSLIRFRRKGEKPEFAHTLNASGVATSRLMVALLENNQKEDGSIAIPHELGRYLEEEITRLP